MPLTHRLTTLGGGFTAKLSIMLSRSATAYVTREHLASMCFIHQRVASVRAAAHLETAFQFCQRARASCDFASAAAGYRQLVGLGHLASHAELAWITLDGRKGLARDIEGGFRIAQQGSRLGCVHSCGVLSYCHVYSYGCEEDLYVSTAFPTVIICNTLVRYYIATINFSTTPVSVSLSLPCSIQDHTLLALHWSFKYDRLVAMRTSAGVFQV